jgi:hypothetical protein
MMGYEDYAHATNTVCELRNAVSGLLPIRS